MHIPSIPPPKSLNGWKFCYRSSSQSTFYGCRHGRCCGKQLYLQYLVYYNQQSYDVGITFSLWRWEKSSTCHTVTQLVSGAGEPRSSKYGLRTSSSSVPRKPVRNADSPAPSQTWLCIFNKTLSGRMAHSSLRSPLLFLWVEAGMGLRAWQLESQTQIQTQFFCSFTV